MTLKLDMSKVYDRVEWNFLRSVMERLRFDNMWISLVMKYITSISYSILLNEEARSSFIPTRGDRQEDPLFPYRFITYVEALTCLLKQEEASPMYQLVLAHVELIIFFFFVYAGDSLLFCQVNSLEWNRILPILEIYEKASG